MARARQPRKVDILGVQFSVIKSTKKMPDATDHGETVVVERRIYLNPMVNKTPDDMASTFLHEVIHAILGVSGQDSLIKEDHEEGLVTALEHGLYPLIKQGVFMPTKPTTRRGVKRDGKS